jgi:hypothetical protein
LGSVPRALPWASLGCPVGAEDGDVFNEGGFEVALAVAMALVQPEELEDERFFENVGRVGDDLSFFGEFSDALLVPAEGEAFVKAAVELAFQFANGPALIGGFDLVKAALVGVLDRKKEDVMSPAKAKVASVCSGFGHVDWCGH